MILVTLSRQIGSHGEEIAQKVAEDLAIPYVAQEIIHEAAVRSGVSEDILQAVDERRPSLLDRIASVVLGLAVDEEMNYPISPNSKPPVLAPETFRRLIEGVFREIAEKGSAVIVGRGAHLILSNRPNVLRVQIYAPFEVRAERVAAQEGISKKAAEKVVRESDRHRAGYFESYFGVDWREPNQYDLMINTDRVSDELAVSMITSAANMIAATT